jgi:hypothetical protein
MPTKLGTVFLLGSLALAPGVARADGAAHSLEQVLVESADSPADHAALANHFRAKAAEARQDAKLHQHMARSYAGGKMMEREQMRKHCEKLAADDEAIAAEYDELAKVHDAEAKKAK